jgi:hypothetical protein
MRYKIKINEEKFNELKNKLRPNTSYLALAGIIVFFFVPEIIAFFWGEEIKHFFLLKQEHSSGILKFLYSELKSLGENSIFNIVLGFLFVIWFFKVRKDSQS